MLHISHRIVFFLGIITWFSLCWQQCRWFSWSGVAGWKTDYECFANSVWLFWQSGSGFVLGCPRTEEFVPGFLLVLLSQDKGTAGQGNFFLSRYKGTARQGNFFVPGQNSKGLPPRKPILDFSWTEVFPTFPQKINPKSVITQHRGLDYQVLPNSKGSSS